MNSTPLGIWTREKLYRVNFNMNVGKDGECVICIRRGSNAVNALPVKYNKSFEAQSTVQDISQEEVICMHFHPIPNVVGSHN